MLLKLLDVPLDLMSDFKFTSLTFEIINSTGRSRDFKKNDHESGHTFDENKTPLYPI